MDMRIYIVFILVFSALGALVLGGLGLLMGLDGILLVVMVGGWIGIVVGLSESWRRSLKSRE